MHKARCGCTLGLMMLAGCFSERSYPIRAADLVLLTESGQRPLTARAWAVDAHRDLRRLLPAHRRRALLTEDLVAPDGRPAEVFKHFGLRFEHMDSLLGNLEGLLHTAHLSATKTYVDETPPPWPGFEDVWIPVDEDLELSGRLGLATSGGQTLVGDCVVILPGLFGDSGVLRTRDLAVALHENGLHVLSLEMRACGRTEAQYSDVPTCWGVLETGDLLAVAAWLEAKPEIRRTGLIGYCWGATIALLSAWADGRGYEHPSVTPEFAGYVAPPPEAPHFQAGILAFSPVLRQEELMDQLDQPRSGWTHPILHAFQGIIRDRMIAKGHEPVTGSLRQLVEAEIAGYDMPFENAVWHGLRYLRLLPYHGEPAGDKLEQARMPVLIVHAANDPLISAQDVADLMAMTENPNVAAIVLPGGGHVGFPAYARGYYYSLIANFFSPTTGPRPVDLASEVLVAGSSQRY